MCGSCKEGLSETLGSVHCKVCDDTNWALVLGLPLVYTLVAMYFWTSARSMNSSQIPSSSIILTKCLAYFYQIVPFLLTGAAWPAVAQPLQVIFAMRVASSSSGTCIFPGMDAMGKQLVLLIGPVWILIFTCTGMIGAFARAQLRGEQLFAMPSELTIVWQHRSKQARTAAVTMPKFIEKWL